MRGEPLTRRAGRAFVFLWFLLGGIGHFAMTHAFATIVPPSIPHPVAVVYLSGVFELFGAFGILLEPTRRLAGWGLLLLTVAVTPANVYMWQHAAQFPVVPPWLLLLRLPVQAALLACIWWSTRRYGRRRY
ncbi:MAG: DoxX family protein [Janthinobacterium lividum]